MPSLLTGGTWGNYLISLSYFPTIKWKEQKYIFHWTILWIK